MSMSNEDRMLHGQSLQQSIENILTDFVDKGYIKSFTPDYYIGKPGYQNTKQFYVAFLVEINDTERWALYSTTSMKDRFKGQLWDAFHIKEIDPSVSKAFLIYPDGLSTSNERPFLKRKEDIVNKIGYYPHTIDDILSQSDFVNYLEDYALDDNSDGSKRGVLGNKFEDRVARLLSYANNLAKWKTDAQNLEGLHYDMFVKIVDCFGLSKNDTMEISATADKKVIGKLPSGGNPKTDVLVTVTLSDEQKKNYTISCKRSGAKDVSIHDYTADQFADVLDPNNKELRLLLEGFQAAGSMSDFGEANCKRFTETLAPYIEKLTKWAIGGQGGDGNPDTQWADYILVYDADTNVSSIHHIEEYIRLLSQAGYIRNFGSPFGWTYPSKQRGKRIQLKGRIINDEGE